MDQIQRALMKALRPVPSFNSSIPNTSEALFFETPVPPKMPLRAILLCGVGLEMSLLASCKPPQYI